MGNKAINTDEFEVADAFPDANFDGLKKDVDEAVRRFEIRRANKKPTFKWVKEDSDAGIRGNG